MYAPYSEQPQVARDRSELNESEKLVYDRYSTKEYVDKFVSLVALEEQKGRDKFRHRQVYFFKVRLSALRFSILTNANVT